VRARKAWLRYLLARRASKRIQDHPGLLGADAELTILGQLAHLPRRRVRHPLSCQHPVPQLDHFKKQCRAMPSLVEWRYHVLRGNVDELRRANPKYQRLIRWWKQLPP